MSVALWIDVFHQQNQDAEVTVKGLTLTGFTSLVVKQRDEKAAADSAAAIAAEKQAAELAALQSEIKRQEIELEAAREEKITLLNSKKNQAIINYNQLMDGLKGKSLDALETANECVSNDGLAHSFPFTFTRADEDSKMHQLLACKTSLHAAYFDLRDYFAQGTEGPDTANIEAISAEFQQFRTSTKDASLKSTVLFVRCKSDALYPVLRWVDGLPAGVSSFWCADFI